jgi:hypothetical protein
MAHRTTRKANVDYVISPVKPPPLRRAKVDPVSESPVDSDKLPYKRNQYHQNAAALCKLPSPKHSSTSRTKLLEVCEILGLSYTLRHDLQDMP